MPDSSKISLIIGIDQFNSSQLEGLPSCRKDANDLHAVLSKLDFQNFKDSPIIGSNIIKDELSWAKIRETICDFFREAKPSQILLFYFSGHGIVCDNDVFLSTPQIDPMNPRSRGFSLCELTNCMGSSKSRQIIGIIDACYSGNANLPASSAMKKAAADSERRLALASYDKVWKKTPKTKGISLLLSSRSYEPSNALNFDNSLYTKYLIEGLLGVKNSIDQNGLIIQGSGSINESGYVTPQSLHDYVYYKVANFAEQVPELKSDQSSRIIIAVYPELVKASSDSKPEQLPSQINENTKTVVNQRDVNFISSELTGDLRNRAEGLIALARTFIEDNKYEKAEECLRKALQINPDNAETLAEVGHKYKWISENLSLDNVEEGNKFYILAKECYKKALIIDSKNFDAVISLALIFNTIGENFAENKKYAEAIENFKESIKSQKKALELYIEKTKPSSEQYWKKLIDMCEDLCSIYVSWWAADKDWEKSIKQNAKKESKELGQSYSEIEKKLMTQRNLLRYDDNVEHESYEASHGESEARKGFKEWKKQQKIH
jgi:tetratricopeptide (TPR) repeat protein